jgi:hypothetical protein
MMFDNRFNAGPVLHLIRLTPNSSEAGGLSLVSLSNDALNGCPEYPRPVRA